MRIGSLPRLIAVAALALVAAACGAAGTPDAGEPAPAADTVWQSAPSGALVVSLAVSPEKELALKPLIERYNASKPKVGSKVVFVEGRTVASGAAESKIVAGTLKPTVWSPASSMWGRLLNFETDQPLTADENPSIFRTPLVIAMWEPMAKALGYPGKQLGFADILKLAQSDQGWAAYGVPQYGEFKLVHTNPDFSTAGLSAVVAEYYAATGKKEGLQVEDLTGPARQTVRDIERSIVHYGDTTLFIADHLVDEGPGYASAVAMEEVTLLDVNRRLAEKNNGQKLVAIYPQEGTFYSDNPFLILNAPWVSAEQKQAASALQLWLAKEITPQVAATSGFRPADLDVAPVSPVDAAHGVDPTQPKRVLGLPTPRVLDALRKTWREDRKPANVLLVVDTSGSMEGERIENAKSGLQSFLREAAPQDHVGLMRFSADREVLVDVAPVSENREQLRSAVESLRADGGTAFHDAAAEGFDLIRGLRDRERINAVVLLTDGEDTDSSLSAEDVMEKLGAQGDTSNQVRVFTIAYSDGAEGAQGTLEGIADASGGNSYTGNTDDIQTVYRSISSFF